MDMLLPLVISGLIAFYFWRLQDADNDLERRIERLEELFINKDNFPPADEDR